MLIHSPFRTLRRIFLLAALCSIQSFALALDPAIGLDGYRHDRWGEQEGAPRFVDAIAQSGDGWLWVAGRQRGLFRFDGVRFHPYESIDGSRPQGPNISVLRPGRDGALWIGHGSGGVSVLQGGRFRHLMAPAQTSSVYAIVVAPDGTAWVACRSGLFHIAAGKVERIGPERGYDTARAEYVLADRAGSIWVADGDMLHVLTPGTGKFKPVRAVRADPMMIEANDGSVWLVLGKEFERVAPPTARAVAAPPGRSSSFQSLFDADGNLWSGNCPVGLCVLRPTGWQSRAGFTPLGAAERFDQAWQMTSLTILSLMEDRDGSIWVGTPAGLERLRDKTVHMMEPLFDRGKSHAALHPDGSIYVVQVRKLDDTTALWRIVNGRVTALPNPLNVRALNRAPDGTLVLAGQNGIERHRPDGVQRIPVPPVPPALAGSVRIDKVKAGVDDIWLWNGRLGVWHWRNGHWTPPSFAPKDDMQRVALDAAGRSFHGHPGNRLRIVDGAAVREYGPADGIAIGRFQHIAPGNPLLISGLNGTQILASGRFHDVRFDVPGGLGPISGIIVDAHGTRWLNAQRGIFRVTAKDWARTGADPEVPLGGKLFDAIDGYVGGAETGSLADTAFAAPDGKLWFAGERGLAWMDPRKPTVNPVTPDVTVLSLSANGKRYPATGPVELPKGTEDVQIEYTTPSLRVPERVTFRYRLAGTDDAWEDAGTRRTAFFQRLDPGEHAFEVMALNEDGVPSRAGTLRFRIVPRLTQTWWFYGGCTLAALLAIALAYRLRMRQVAARIEDRLLVRVRERESIARSLHDTFLQSVQGMLLSMHAVIVKLPGDSPVRAEFERVLERAEAVLMEGRDEVKGLRGDFATAGEFWQILLRDVELTSPQGLARVRLVTPEAIGSLQPKLRSDVYAIAREALTNALRHTPGPVTLLADAAARAFTLSVSDEGTGLGEFGDGKPGHFGLPGMRERATQIGARLHLESSRRGTCVILVIPAAHAYTGDVASDIA